MTTHIEIDHNINVTVEQEDGGDMVCLALPIQPRDVLVNHREPPDNIDTKVLTGSLVLHGGRIATVAPTADCCFNAAAARALAAALLHYAAEVER